MRRFGAGIRPSVGMASAARAVPGTDRVVPRGEENAVFWLHRCPEVQVRRPKICPDASPRILPVDRSRTDSPSFRTR